MITMSPEGVLPVLLETISNSKEPRRIVLFPKEKFFKKGHFGILIFYDMAIPAFYNFLQRHLK